MADSKLVGKKAPALGVPDQDGKTVKLDEYKGRWVVLYFYPNDDTPGCTTEACDFTNGLKDFEKLDASILGCSPNSARRATSKFIAKYKLKVRLLSDPEHTVMEKYGATWGREGPLRQRSPSASSARPRSSIPRARSCTIGRA